MNIEFGFYKILDGLTQGVKLTNTLVPASILTTVLIVIIGNVFKSWVAEYAKNARILLSDDDDHYEDDEEEDDDEPEPPPVTRIHPNRNNRNRR
jgi:hypothetical protein